MKWVLGELNQGQISSGRCHRLAQATRCAIKELGLEVFSQSPSPSVTSIKVPKELDGEKIKQYIFEKFNISIAGGQDQLKGKILRIGHLGFIRDEDLVATIRGLGDCLWAMGWTVDERQIARAVQVVYEQLKVT